MVFFNSHLESFAVTCRGHYKLASASHIVCVFCCHIEPDRYSHDHEYLSCRLAIYLSLFVWPSFTRDAPPSSEPTLFFWLKCAHCCLVCHVISIDHLNVSPGLLIPLWLLFLISHFPLAIICSRWHPPDSAFAIACIWLLY